MTTQITPCGLPLSGNNERGRKGGGKKFQLQFFVVGYRFWDVFAFFFFCSHESPAQCAGFLCERETASTAYGEDVLLGSSGQAEGEDEAAAAAGPPWGPQGAGDSQGSRGYPGRAALQD